MAVASRVGKWHGCYRLPVGLLLGPAPANTSKFKLCTKFMNVQVKYYASRLRSSQAQALSGEVAWALISARRRSDRPPSPSDYRASYESWGT
jgi:hypothetical protein